MLIPFFAYGNDFGRFDAVVFPEYYYPGIMVEIQAEPDSGRSFPAFSIVVPIEADSAFMVLQSGGDPISLDLTPDRGGKRIDIPESKTPVRIFYFYPRESIGDSISFSYDLEINTFLKDAHILIQEPMVAEQFKISESGSEIFQDPHGLTFHRFHVAELKSGEKKSFFVSYQNTSGKTTMDVLRNLLSTDQPDMSRQEPILSSKVIQRHTLPTWQPLTVLGVFAVIVGMLFQRQRKREENSDADPFCTNCGSKKNTDDTYCAKCGKEL